MKKLIEDLTTLVGVSSREDQVIQYMLQAFQKVSSNIQIDKLGNLICHFPSGKKNAKKAMIFGHMDEIGFVIRQIEKDGFLRVDRVGGVHVQILPGTRVNILGSKGNVPGIIGIKSHHFMKPIEKNNLPTIESLYVDIGASSAQHARQLGVEIGQFICFQSNFVELADGLISNKSMDNRVACAILIELANRLGQTKEKLNWDVYLVACVQEEVNIRGILPAVRRIQPDISIGIDVTPACDTPELKGFTPVELGKGPAFTFYNFHGRGTLAGVMPDERLLQTLIKTAKENQISYQREVAIGVITENAYILFEEHGIPVASLSVPTRYTHTPVETVSVQDVEQVVKVLYPFLTQLDEDSSFGKDHLLR
ncbi:Putative aminopeptidase FrvX [Seinonella peptonophila]|uniref:Putative aminopeptidase FrvX n=1 Tax=Seinonella peptonophila TaxID=112248 RepID=A0A1M4V5Z5_9BACL|nr:M42 family metallopeptidase [Seinonella peptonophila]SHE64411.1 Putative aminopeptidase FrvX [Seinonella peptonophila]